MSHILADLMATAEPPIGDALPTLRFISLGGGVQSSVLALMAARGEFEGVVPDCAIYADTQWDPPETMNMIEWLTDHLPFDVHVVTAGDLKACLEGGVNTSGSKFISIPVFLRHETSGKLGMSQRQCTREFKIAPIVGKVRELLGVPKGGRVPPGVTVERWLGISSDEIVRMKESRHPWEQTRWPLVEVGMGRRDCEAWWRRNAPVGAPPLARSACVGCPFHDSHEWVGLADQHPDLINEAAAIEALMQEARMSSNPHIPYLHSRRIPLLEAIALDRRKVANLDAQGSLFGAECEGMCGV